MKSTKFSDYKNPDKRCSYPFTPEALGYCWGYAGLWDKAKNAKELKRKALKFCPDCGMWR